jgi:hypothetical protein
MKSRSAHVRRGLVVASLAVAAVTGGSRPASASGTAATVNGESISVDEFQDTVSDVAAAGFIQLTEGGALVGGDEARAVLGEMITNLALRQQLEADGIDPDQGADEADPSQPDLLNDSERYRQLLGETGAYDLSAVEEEYESTGGANGLLCAVVMLPADEATAEEASAALADGGEFSDVAADLGIQIGGLGGGEAQPCAPTDGLDPQVLDPLAEALDAVEVGEATEAFEIQGSQVIAMAPPFDDVSSALAGDVVEAAVDDVVAAAVVTVDPRYGRWDAAAQRIVTLATPAT